MPPGLSHWANHRWPCINTTRTLLRRFPFFSLFPSSASFPTYNSGFLLPFFSCVCFCLPPRAGLYLVYTSLIHLSKTPKPKTSPICPQLPVSLRDIYTHITICLFVFTHTKSIQPLITESGILLARRLFHQLQSYLHCFRRTPSVQHRHYFILSLFYLIT